MNSISDLTLIEDIANLPKEMLVDMAINLDIPTDLQAKELSALIWERISHNREQKENLLCDIKPRVFAGRTSATWYKLDSGASLKGAKQNIIQNCGFNPFESLKIPDKNQLTSTPVLIGAASYGSENEYYLRFMHKKGSTQLFYADQLQIIPKTDTTTVYINEDKNLIEIRTDSRTAPRFAKVLSTIIKQEVSLSQIDILAPYGCNIESIAERLDGELVDSTAKPEMELDESLTEEQNDALANIFIALDKYFHEENDSRLIEDLQCSKTTMGTILSSVPFAGLVLSGLRKIGFGVENNDTDLRSSPLYKAVRPHVQSQGGQIKFSLNDDGVDNIYSIQVGISTKSIYFRTPASELAIQYVREKLIF